MSAILTVAVTTSVGTVVASAVAGIAGFLGARRGAQAGLESGRAERMWENRVYLYEDLAAWVRQRREVHDRWCPACLRGEPIQLEPRKAPDGFPRAGQLEIWASPEVGKLRYEFAWWDDWIYLEILAIQDPTGEGRHIVASKQDLQEIYMKAIRTGDLLVERIRAELSGQARPSRFGPVGRRLTDGRRRA